MAQSEEIPSSEGDAEERRLIDRSAAGDQEAFRQLVLRYHRLVINVAFRALGEVALAEDVAQDVFIKVYKSLPTYRHDKPFKHWLHRVAAKTGWPKTAVRTSLSRSRSRCRPTARTGASSAAWSGGGGIRWPIRGHAVRPVLEGFVMAVGRQRLVALDKDVLGHVFGQRDLA